MRLSFMDGGRLKSCLGVWSFRCMLTGSGSNKYWALTCPLGPFLPPPSKIGGTYCLYTWHLTLYNKRNEHDWFCSGLLSAASTMNISVSEKFKQTGRSLAGRLLTWDLARYPCDWGSQTSMPCSCKRTTTLWWNHGLWRRLYLIVMFGWDEYILDIRIDIVRSKYLAQRESPILHFFAPLVVGKLCLNFHSEPHMVHIFQSPNQIWWWSGLTIAAGPLIPTFIVGLDNLQEVFCLNVLWSKIGLSIWIKYGFMIRIPEWWWDMVGWQSPEFSSHVFTMAPWMWHHRSTTGCPLVPRTARANNVGTDCDGFPTFFSHELPIDILKLPYGFNNPIY